MTYKPTIGLEVHVQLRTETKMFCNSKNNPDETKPNINVCPVCMGHPGTLPVINKKAVEHVLRVGVALDGTLADFTEFDRKNYFYPDIPKGYQISQYKYPLVSGGKLGNVELTRIHLEEDTARNVHTKTDESLIDFNRAGVPLMELVTEAVIKSAEEASDFAKNLQLLVRYLGVSGANLEKGEMRVEANISVSEGEELGTKIEIKNLNSIKAVRNAIDYEVKRQSDILSSGGDLVQETRGWDEDKQETFSQRTKETSEDYRYFPEPDLPKLKLSEIKEFSEDTLRKTLPELPWEKDARYQELGLSEGTSSTLVGNLSLGTFFDKVADTLDEKNLILASNYITSDVAGSLERGGDLILSSEDFSGLIQLISDGELSSRGAKDVLKIMIDAGGNPREIAEEEGLFQKSDESELVGIVEKIISDNKSVVKDYKEGKESALQFLIGQGMKESKGSANPSVLKKLLEEKLK